jgi:hypothetical protein
LKAFSWTANSHTKQQALSKSKEPAGMLLLYSILILLLRSQFAASEWPVPWLQCSYLSVLLKDVINCTKYTNKSVNMERWWKETAREEAKSWEKNLSQYNFVHHKPDIEWTGVQPAENPTHTNTCSARKVSFVVIIIIYMNIFQKKVALNAESFLIVLSQTVYRLRSPVNP